MKTNRRNLLVGAAGLAAGAAGANWLRRASPKPANVVLIVTDDQGYNDLGCYFDANPTPGGARPHTPHLDRLAKTGVRFSDYCVTSSVCTPSRASLLTGCYPPRVGFGATAFPGTQVGVLTPTSDSGLHPDEETLADLFRRAGYATGCVGKWHLGHRPAFLPTRQGFDGFYGIPYSNNQRPLPLMRDEEIIRRLPEEPLLTRPFTQAAVTFITRHQERPFFLYLAHSAPHTPWRVPEGRRDKSRSLYADVIREIDWSVGQLLETLERLGLREDTLIVFGSDNGPWVHAGLDSGSAWPYRGGKAQTWEGGFRTPLLASWPTILPSGAVHHQPVASIDLLPTLAQIMGLDLPNKPIDGAACWNTFAADAPNPREGLAYYARGRLEAVRIGRWKLVFKNTQRAPAISGGLFNLQADPAERTDVSAQHPERVTQLRRYAERTRTELGDALTGVTGLSCRPLGYAAAAV